MKSIEKQIQHARPKLRVVSPISHWIVMIMAFFNIILGISLWFLVDESRVSASLLIVNDLFTFKFWGVVFILIGIVKLYALLTNNWNLARKSLFLGVSVKAAWMVALIIRILISPGTILVSLLWATIALLQIGGYIWFLPPSNISDKQLKRENAG